MVAIEDQLVFTNGGGQIHKLTFGNGFPQNPKDVQVTQLATLTTEEFTSIQLFAIGYYVLAYDDLKKQTWVKHPQSDEFKLQDFKISEKFYPEFCDSFVLFGFLKYDFNYMLVGVDENGNVFEKQTPVKYHNHEPVFTSSGWHLKEE